MRSDTGSRDARWCNRDPAQPGPLESAVGLPNRSSKSRASKRPGALLPDVEIGRDVRASHFQAQRSDAALGRLTSWRIDQAPRLGVSLPGAEIGRDVGASHFRAQRSGATSGRLTSGRIDRAPRRGVERGMASRRGIRPSLWASTGNRKRRGD